MKTEPTAAVGRVWSGIGVSGMGQFLNMLQAIILVPFFFKAWGKEAYDHWVTLFALVQYLSFLDLGGQNYLANVLAAHHARGDEEEFRKTISRGVSFFVLLCSAAFLAMSLALWICTDLSLPFLNRPLSSDEAWIIELLGISVLVGVPAGVYLTAYRAVGQFSQGGHLGNLLRAASLLVFVGVLAGKTTPVLFAWANLATSLLTTAIHLRYMRRRVPTGRNIRLSLSAAREGARYVTEAFPLWVVIRVPPLLAQGMVLILGALAPGAQALFVTHRTLSSIPGYIGALVQAPIHPEFTFIWAQKRYEDLFRATRLAIRGVLFTTGATSVLIWLGADLLYSSWTNRVLELDRSLFGLLLLQGFLSAGWTTATWGMQAANDNRRLAQWSVARAGVTLLLCLALTPSYGAVGIVIAGIAGDIGCGLLVLPFLAARFLGVKPRRLYLPMLGATAAVLPLGVAAYLSCLWLEGWKALLLFSGSALALTYPVLYWLVGPEVLRRSWETFRTLGGMRRPT